MEQWMETKMKLTSKRLKQLIKEELRKLSESTQSTGDPHVDLLIDGLNMLENIFIEVSGDDIIAEVTVDEGVDPIHDDFFINHIYSFNIKNNTMTQGYAYSYENQVHPFHLGADEYIHAKPKSALEFLKLISDKFGGLK